LAEVDDRLRQFPNVIIAKDYHTSIEQELALIQTAVFHMGAPSGLVSMAVFNSKPYLVVKWNIVPHHYRALVREDGFLRLCFAHPQQRCAVGVETPELLITEFARMWEAVHGSSWQPPVSVEENLGGKFFSWLR
jgi:hypothetical protein